MYSDAVLADSPLLYWRLNEVTPGTGSAADSSGNGRNGTYVGSPTGVAGLVINDTDLAVQFNGSSQWVTSTYNPFAVGGTLTFECWWKRNTRTTNDCIWGGSQASTQPFFTQSLNVDDISFFTSAGAAGQTWTNAALFGNVFHLALTFTGSTKVSELWVNGVSQGTKTHSTDFDIAPGNFNLCKRSASSDPADGTVDDMAIYGSILRSDQIRAHYQAGGGMPRAQAFHAIPFMG
jgi:Concanavalin A-like lectin/glucanases superfamily